MKTRIKKVTQYNHIEYFPQVKLNWWRKWQYLIKRDGITQVRDWEKGFGGHSKLDVAKNVLAEYTTLVNERSQKTVIEYIYDK